MAELIQKTDTLNQGREKLNTAITDAETAKNISTQADDKATQALTQSESTQTQLDTIVINGDSSVEAAQARVDAKGNPHTTLKARLDAEHASVTSQLADVAINVKSFGAIGDGMTDDTQAIKNASDFASQKNSTLLIPDGEFLVTGQIDIKTDVVCIGKILTPNNENNAKPTILIAREHEGIPISLNGQFNKGTSKIPQLGQYVGHTIVLNSDETLIKRDNNGVEIYKKNDTFIVVDKNGTISPELSCSYQNLSTATIIAYQPTRPIKVNINLEVIEGLGIRPTSLIEVRRSHVDIGVTLNNLSKADLRYGLGITGSYGVQISKPQIDGITDPGYGYGIYLYKSSLINISDGIISNVRASIDGHGSNGVSVHRGTYVNRVGPHWGHNYLFDNITVTDTDGGSQGHIPFAGSNISVKNSRFIGGKALVKMRTDAFELSGRVDIIDNEVILKSLDTFHVFDNINEKSFDYGKRVELPSFINIEGNAVISENPIKIRWMQGSAGKFLQTGYRSISVKNNKVRGFDVTSIANMPEVNLIKNTSYFNGGHVDLIIDKLEHLYLYIKDDSPAWSDNYFFRLNISDVVGMLDLQTATSAINDNMIVNCTIKRLVEAGTVKANSKSSTWLINCLLDSTEFKTGTRLNLSNCVFKGAQTYQNTLTLSYNFDKGVDASYGNVSLPDASNTPVLNGTYSETVPSNPGINDRGKIIYVPGGTNDQVLICVRVNGVFKYVSLI